MYEMYPWDGSAERAERPERSADAGPAWRDPLGRRQPVRRRARPAGGAVGRPAEAATRAVQFALDRRDNGGYPGTSASPVRF
jgi:hypothetical protein